MSDVLFPEFKPKQRRKTNPDRPCCPDLPEMGWVLSTVHHLCHASRHFTEGQVADATSCTLYQAARAMEKAEEYGWVTRPDPQWGKPYPGRGRMWVSRFHSRRR